MQIFILYFPIAHFQILLGGLHISKTIVYAKFGGQTECIMGNWKIENSSTDLTNISLLDSQSG